MRISTPTKIIVLIVVCVATSLITSSILGQSGQQVKRKARPAKPTTSGRPAVTAAVGSTISGNQKVTSYIELPANAQPGPQTTPQIPSDRVTNHYNIGGMAVGVFDGSVVVDANANVFDKRPGISLIWSMRVSTKDTKTLVKEHFYADQIFSITGKAPQTITFHDSFNIAPGSYRVQLILHALHPGITQADLQKDSVSRSLRVCASNRYVVVTN